MIQNGWVELHQPDTYVGLATQHVDENIFEKGYTIPLTSGSLLKDKNSRGGGNLLFLSQKIQQRKQRQEKQLIFVPGSLSSVGPHLSLLYQNICAI